MQILSSEGDGMNRRLSICIIIFLVVLLLFGIWYGRRLNTKMEPEETQELVTEETTIVASAENLIEYAYIVRAADGKLVVYLEDGKTVYMETGIRIENLSQQMQEKSSKGIGFTTLESLYDFLESYSS